MKVLLSAYACEPRKGPEPEVRWYWALEVARLGHDNWVLTRANNQPAIEAELAGIPPSENLHLLYYDLPMWARWWKHGVRGVHLYYRLWQLGAYRMAKRLHAQQRFDRAHHVTFATIRHPSFLGRLGVPFVFGPVAGGDRIPRCLRNQLGIRGWLTEAIRDFRTSLSLLILPFEPRSGRQKRFTSLRLKRANWCPPHSATK